MLSTGQQFEERFVTIEISKTVDISQKEDARESVLEALKNNHCTITNQSEDVVSAKRGSQLEMRTLGGMLVEPEVLPVTVEVTFANNHITINAKDDLGVGLMIGMETKYHLAVQEIAEIVEKAVSK